MSEAFAGGGFLESSLLLSEALAVGLIAEENDVGSPVLPDDESMSSIAAKGSTSAVAVAGDTSIVIPTIGTSRSNDLLD